MSEPPFGRGVYIADTSARALAGHPAVREEWAAAVRSRQIATCSITTLELVDAARDAGEVRKLEMDEACSGTSPVTVSVQRLAIAALRAQRGRRRISPRQAARCAVAAAAEQAGIGVLHDHQHYDRLAEVLRFESRSIAAPGTL